VDSFLENAQRIFDIARSEISGPGESSDQDFVLLIGADGGLSFVMESPASAPFADARIAYRVTRTAREGVRVAGRSGTRECVLRETRQPAGERRFARELLRDRPLYRISSPLTLCASSPSGRESV
jgi:hypothetical protein